MLLYPYSATLPYSTILNRDSAIMLHMLLYSTLCVLLPHIILPPLQAAEDARRQMGNRRFYDQMLMDACHHHQLKVTDEVDVTTMKEYMQVRFTVRVCVHLLPYDQSSRRVL